MEGLWTLPVEQPITRVALDDYVNTIPRPAVKFGAKEDSSQKSNKSKF